MPSSSGKPGFKGSTTVACEVFLYSHTDDPILPKVNGGVWEFRATDIRGKEPALRSLTTNKSLRGVGTFSIAVVVPRAEGGAPDFYDTLVDDDWIDLVVNVSGKRYHTLRGIIDTFREDIVTEGSGATTRVVTITGYDFTQVFVKTLVWFNQFRAENVSLTAALTTFDKLRVGGNVALCVSRMLYGFMDTMTSAKPPRANWTLPPGMPLSIPLGGPAAILRRLAATVADPNAPTTFPDTFIYQDSAYTDFPARYALAQTYLNPNGAGCWALAQEWSDPSFCELISDLYGADELPIEPDREYNVTDTVMAVVLRDIPFPTVEQDAQSPYFRLPMAVVAPQDVVSRNVGRGGAERYNAFFVSPQALQALGANALDLQGPLWDVESIARHGMRPFYVDSKFIAEKSSLGIMSVQSRVLAMNYHCLNPYFLNGTIGLSRIRPDIRVGTRLRITGATPEEDITFYVEEVSHSWSLGRHSTSIGVTRGWRGTDASLLTALTTMAARYEILPGKNVVPQKPEGTLAVLEGVVEV